MAESQTRKFYGILTCTLVVLPLFILTGFTDSPGTHLLLGLRSGIMNHTLEAQPKPLEIPTHYKITVEIQGRLGNQLFKLASLQGIATTNNMHIVLPKQLLHLFKIFKLKPSLRDHVEGGAEIKYSTFKDINSASYDGKTKNILDNINPRTNVFLKGYYQSFRYFENIKNDLRSQFEFKDNIKEKVNAFLLEHTPSFFTNKSVTYIGIHVRRGDFLLEKLKTRGPVSVNETYIHNAKKYMRKMYHNILFVATSDDKKWAANHVVDNSTILSSFSKAEEDLALLASCNHTIISSGSFSWWAGWLANGTTVYFSLYPTPGSVLHKSFKKEDYYPSDWIPLT